MRTALVTGASRGIGRGIALELATKGFGLTITSRNGSDLAALAGDLLRAGAAEVHARAADLADSAALEEVVAAHAAAFASMNALVLSGGVGTAGPLETQAASRVERIFKVNLFSAVTLVQRSLPLLRLGAREDPQHGARVVALSSITGIFAEPGLAAYGASKAALLSLIETLNVEESPGGVMATAIAPAYVQTDMSTWTTDVVPAERMITVEDVVAVVRMLLQLGRSTSISRLVMSRSGTNDHRA